MVNIVNEICKHPIHPFPARMAPRIVWENLPRKKRKSLSILDPMVGSGTSLVIGRAMGHKAIGFDRDPLALLIATAWCTDVDKDAVRVKAKEILERAKKRYKRITLGKAYPRNADEETRAFIRYWFDKVNRRQLAALSDTISRVRNADIRVFLWCAFSRLIITKKVGVSLAMDVSHSRPHRVYDKAPIKVFDRFESSVEKLLRRLPFESSGQDLPKAEIKNGDARGLPLSDNSIDMVITSPPYLNAIDYLRGHKLSLVWMEHSIGEIRHLRSTNIGAETCHLPEYKRSNYVRALNEIGEVGKLSERTQKTMLQYAWDMDLVISEIKRVLKKKGQVIFVVGDSTICGTFVKNSRLVEHLCSEHGLTLRTSTIRKLPENRRYLPPPNSKKSGVNLQRRMRKEVVLTFVN